MNQKKENKKFFILALASILLLLMAGQTLAQGTFTATGSMTTTRLLHTSTLLANGNVLLVGGSNTDNCCNFLASAELYDPVTGTFASTGSMSSVRAGHTATVLNNGKVLIAGGSNGSWPYGGQLGAELYDPATGTFTATAGSMTTPRVGGHSAVLLADGKVLIVGGQANSLPGGGLASAELYDSATDTFAPTGSMSTNRYGPATILLANGKVLIVGGEMEGGTLLASAELYDPNTGSFTATGSMVTPRRQHTAAHLNTGKVLVVGGANNSGVLASAELYDPVSGIFTLRACRT